MSEQDRLLFHEKGYAVSLSEYMYAHGAMRLSTQTPYSDSSGIFLLHRYVHLPAVLTDEELAHEIDPVLPCEPKVLHLMY